MTKRNRDPGAAASSRPASTGARRGPATGVEPGWALPAVVGLFAVAAAWFALRSTGAYHDDDLDHYFMARAALSQPHFLLDPWGRPGFTILYALPAQLGWTAVRLFTVLLAALTLVVTHRTARRLGYSAPWSAAGLAGWQPLFFLLSFSALTEPLGALLLALVIGAVAAERPRSAAVAAGLLPLVRLELGLVTLIVAGWILLGGRRKDALSWLFVPTLLWALIGGVVNGDPLWLLHVVGGAGRPLASAGPVHYLRNLITVVGPVALLGLGLGLAALATPGDGPRPRFAALAWLSVFTLLALLTWDRLPFGNSIGFLRHLIVLAAPTALLAAAGYEALARPMGRGRRVAFTAVTVGITLLTAAWMSHRLEADFFIRPGRDWSRLIGLAPVALAVLVALVAGARAAALARALPLLAVAAAAAYCLVVLKPIDLNVEQKTVQSAVEYLKQEQLLARPLYANHPWFYFLSGRDRWDRARTPYVTRAGLASAPRGALVVWENHYGQRLYGDVPVEELRADPSWSLLFEVESGDRQFRVAVFERL